MRVQSWTSLRLLTVVVTAVVLGISACNSASDRTGSGSNGSSKQVEKQAEPTYSTGRSAFQRMYVSARTWAIDSQPIRLSSRPEIQTNEPGKSALWSALFASPKMQNTRSYSWSGLTGPNAPEPGVSPEKIDYYSPSNASTRTFDLNFLKIDTDKAFEVAQKNGGEAVLKKNPDMPVIYTLYWDIPHARLLWRVSYGESDVKAKLKVLVNASGGEFVMVEK